MVLRLKRRRAAAFCRALLGSDAATADVMAAVAACRPGSRIELYRLVYEHARRRPGPRPEERSGILARVAALPEEQRAALLLREVARLEHHGVAAVLGRTEAEARTLLVEARVALVTGSRAQRHADHAIDSSVNWVESRAA